MAKKKQAINQKTYDKVIEMLQVLKEELPKDAGYPVYKLLKEMGLSSYMSAAMIDMKLIERVEPGIYKLKYLNVTEKIANDLIRATNKRQTAVTRKYNLKKKEEQEAKKLIESKKQPVEEIVKEQAERAEKKESAKEEHKMKSMSELIYGSEASNIVELRQQMKQANQFILEAKQLILDRDNEIQKLKEYLAHIQKREIEYVHEISILKSRVS